MTAQQWLAENQSPDQPWYRWGTYLSEQQWDTVREDYSPDGAAWDYLPHDQARCRLRRLACSGSRAYRWGEDGLEGFGDRQGQLCFTLALWNGRDSILKERLFGLTNGQNNHGEVCQRILFLLEQHADSLIQLHR